MSVLQVAQAAYSLGTVLRTEAAPGGLWVSFDPTFFGGETS